MDRYYRAFWEQAFEIKFLRHKGMVFQDFFGDIMEKGYRGGDFMRVRPWGPAGDRKSDGYLRSQRILFQVYAPNEVKERETIKKINEDFEGALPYWKDFFDTWVFVHNARDGLSAGVTNLLLDLDRNQKDIGVRHWGFEELRQEIFRLCEEDIAVLLGQVPSPHDFANVGFTKIKPILDVISRAPVRPDLEISPVPRDKVLINRLSENTELLLHLGRRRSHIVRNFLSSYPDPQYGDEVVQSFRFKYEELKTSEIGPDRIFQELQVFAGGEALSEPGPQAAVLTVLAYLFDQCDIFESASEGLAP